MGVIRRKDADGGEDGVLGELGSLSPGEREERTRLDREEADLVEALEARLYAAREASPPDTEAAEAIERELEAVRQRYEDARRGLGWDVR